MLRKGAEGSCPMLPHIRGDWQIAPLGVIGNPLAHIQKACRPGWEGPLLSIQSPFCRAVSSESAA